MKNRGERIKKRRKKEREREREREPERERIPIRAPNIKRFFRIGRYISPVIKIPVAVKFNKSLSRIRVSLFRHVAHVSSSLPFRST